MYNRMLTALQHKKNCTAQTFKHTVCIVENYYFSVISYVHISTLISNILVYNKLLLRLLQAIYKSMINISELSGQLLPIL